MCWTIAVAALVAASPAAGQTPCGRPIESDHTVCQRCYERLNNQAFGGRVYVYVPDIKTRLGGYQPFNICIVEGVYGSPFLDYSGTFDEGKFEQLRRSRNVLATAIRVDKASLGTPSAFKVGADTFRVEPTHVHTSLFGTDTVTLKICR